MAVVMARSAAGERIHEAGVRFALTGGTPVPKAAPKPPVWYVEPRPAAKPVKQASQPAGGPITPAEVAIVLTEYLSEDRRASIVRMMTIISEVAAKHSTERRVVTAAMICSEMRPRYIIEARHEACYRMLEETSHGLATIGAALGGRGHTTVLHGGRSHAIRHGLMMPRLDSDTEATVKHARLVRQHMARQAKQAERYRGRSHKRTRTSPVQDATRAALQEHLAAERQHEKEIVLGNH